MISSKPYCVVSQHIADVMLLSHWPVFQCSAKRKGHFGLSASQYITRLEIFSLWLLTRVLYQYLLANMASKRLFDKRGASQYVTLWNFSLIININLRIHLYILYLCRVKLEEPMDLIGFRAADETFFSIDDGCSTSCCVAACGVDGNCCDNS